MSGSIESLERSLRACDGCSNDHDYICTCRPADVRHAVQTIAQLRDALECLIDAQNGPPLIRDKRSWSEAMAVAHAALGNRDSVEFYMLQARGSK